MLGIDGKYPVDQPKSKILTVVLESCKKSAVKQAKKNQFYFTSSVCLQYFAGDCKTAD